MPVSDLPTILETYKHSLLETHTQRLRLDGQAAVTQAVDLLAAVLDEWQDDILGISTNPQRSLLISNAKDFLANHGSLGGS